MNDKDHEKRTRFLGVQKLVLRPPQGEAVCHLVLKVAPCRGGQALERLRAAQDEGHFATAFGPDSPQAGSIQCSIGYTWLGLQALCVPSAYLRVFARLAPAFAQGAPLRAHRVGDTGPSAPAYWHQDRDGRVGEANPWGLESAHVLLTMHGPAVELERRVSALKECLKKPAHEGGEAALDVVGEHDGGRIGHPGDAKGEWVHFGYRDGLTEPAMADLEPTGSASAGAGTHAIGEFLLGHENDVGVNRFGLPMAPREVRDFFRDSSFGVLRKMMQDVGGFQGAVVRWTEQARREGWKDASPEWIKAKLCGRWPGGQAVRPGQWQPEPNARPEDFELRLAEDPQGQGCPFSSHVRRVNPALPMTDTANRSRPLLRRGMPYGPAVWASAPFPGAQGQSEDERGLLGLFFCAGLDDQYEHVLGQWANRQPPHLPVTEGMARDPLAGQHEDAQAGMRIPLAAPSPGVALTLTGFAPWITTRGSLYAWHPSQDALERLLEQDYLEPKGPPWL